jgi:hypothetical protein
MLAFPFLSCALNGPVIKALGFDILLGYSCNLYNGVDASGLGK